jgi:hypothetical protein
LNEPDKTVRNIYSACARTRCVERRAASTIGSEKVKPPLGKSEKDKLSQIERLITVEAKKKKQLKHDIDEVRSNLTRIKELVK